MRIEHGQRRDADDRLAHAAPGRTALAGMMIDSIFGISAMRIELNASKFVCSTTLSLTVHSWQKQASGSGCSS
jgi:hypothetical protein